MINMNKSVKLLLYILLFAWGVTISLTVIKLINTQAFILVHISDIYEMITDVYCYLTDILLRRVQI